jgi:hypothetical protein
MIAIGIGIVSSGKAILMFLDMICFAFHHNWLLFVEKCDDNWRISRYRRTTESSPSAIRCVVLFDILDCKNPEGVISACM